MLDVGKLAYVFVHPNALYNRAGPCLAFYGYLWTALRIVVEPLTPRYDLTTHWADEAGCLSIVASLSAFMNTVRRLEDHYLRVLGLPPRKGIYPYPTSYTEDETGQQINFEYENRVSEKLIFTAKTDAKGIGPLVVKFARRYSAEAHKLLARLGHAPRPPFRAAESWLSWSFRHIHSSVTQLWCSPMGHVRWCCQRLPISFKRYTKSSSFTATYDPSIYSSTIKPLQLAILCLRSRMSGAICCALYISKLAG